MKPFAPLAHVDRVCAADFDQSLLVAQPGLHGPDDPAMVAHQPVDHAQIPPAAASVVLSGESVSSNSG
jgi:hypothetical protein